MKTKFGLLLFIYCLLSIIDNVSNITIKYKQFSQGDCDDNSNFGLETIQYPKELFGSSIKLNFEEIVNGTLRVVVCRLSDEKLQKFLISSNDFEDVILSCYLHVDLNFSPSEELSLKNATIFGGDAVDLVKEGGNGEDILIVKEIVCRGNGEYLYQSWFDKKIYIRQSSHYEYFPQEQKVTFIYTALVSQNLPANYTFPVTMDFDESKVGFCISSQEIKSSDDNISSINFNCEIDNISQDDSYDFEFNTLIFGPIYSFSEQEKPQTIDDLISIGKMKDLSEEKMPPVFSPEKVSFNNSEKNVIITGKFNEDIEGQSDFEIQSYPIQHYSCSFENATKDIEVVINCDFQTIQYVTNSEEIKFFGCDVFDSKKNELFFFKPIIKKLSQEEIRVDETDESHNNSSSILFRQVCNFEKDKDLESILFSFVGISSEPINKGENLSIIVDLIKENELVAQVVICTSKEDVKPEDGKLVQVEFECKLENIENIEEYTGLEIVGSDGISGIPTDPKLLNPLKVDKLIEKGEIKNYTSEEFKNEEIPIFNATSINTSDSETTGKFTINGELLSNYTLEKKY